MLSKLSSKQKTVLALVSMLVLLTGLLTFAAVTSSQPLGEKHKPIYEYGGDFELPNFALKDYRGKVVVIYFGFLSCTEACPVSMGTIVGALDKLTPQEREKVQILFVSVDPKRDTLENANKFAQYYGKRYAKDKNPTVIKATTGTKQQIDKLTEQYGVFYELKDLEGSALAYTVDHSSRFYMIDGDGKLVTSMNHSTTPTELMAKIKELQAEIQP